jgi:hypothetical protein
MSYASFAAFGNGTIIRDGLRDIPCSINFLCAITEHSPSPSMISLWLNGTKEIDDRATQPLVEMVRTLKEIKQIAAPWPLDFHDARLWKELLTNYRVNVEKQ